jgi:hypothetical protein
MLPPANSIRRSTDVLNEGSEIVNVHVEVVCRDPGSGHARVDHTPPRGTRRSATEIIRFQQTSSSNG